MHKKAQTCMSKSSSHIRAWLLYLVGSVSGRQGKWEVSLEAFVKPCAASGGLIRIIRGLGKFTRFWWCCDPSSSIILVHWGAKCQAGGVARALLCVGLSGLQGRAPGSLAVGGAVEAAGDWTPLSACAWGAAPPAGPTGSRLWTGNNYTVLWKLFALFALDFLSIICILLSLFAFYFSFILSLFLFIGRPYHFLF